jgi:signal transduction histidine kinase
VFFDVADNGRGIAENEYERVFELFRRAGRQDQPGEGIGLAYVRAHVRRLGGDITVTSKLGEGSTFQVRLPRRLSQSSIAEV